MKTSRSIETYRQLFTAFFKIGAFTFGGGYAMIPLIQKETVETHHWVEENDILDILAIAESTPGVLAINSATFIGYKVGGFWGSTLATLGVVLPSFLIITLVAFFIDFVRDNIWVKYVFEGIRAGVVVLMLGSIKKLSKHCPKNLLSGGLMILAFVLSAFAGVAVNYLLIGAAVIGLLYQAFQLHSRKGEIQ